MSATTPQVSLFASAIRAERWLPWYERLRANNDTRFEVVFVGPKAPLVTLPSEFRFIQSDVKGSQCAAIAAQQTKAPVMLQVVDDVEYSEHAVDLMYRALLAEPKVMTTARYFYGERDVSWSQNCTGTSEPRLPLLPVCGMFTRKAYEEAQGFDRRYRHVFWELDFYMRLLIQHGYETRFVNARCVELLEINPFEERLSTKSRDHDYALFNLMWNVEEFLSGRAPKLARRWGFEGFGGDNLLGMSLPSAGDETTHLPISGL